MSKFVPIYVATRALGVSPSTLRRWEASDRPTPPRTEVGPRRYDLAALRMVHAWRPAGTVGRLVLTHKDQLLCFGAELVFDICKAKKVEVVIINQGTDTSFVEELASDALEIATVCSVRLYGSRSHRNQKLVDGMQKTVTEARC